MKGRIVPLILLIIGCGLALASPMAQAEDSTASPYNQVCSSTKTGRLVISPTSLQFYVNQEQLDNPEPITIRLTGFALPNCIDGNCTSEKIPRMRCYDVDSTGARTSNSSNATGQKCYPLYGTDDLSMHSISWPETLNFCWIAAPTEQWIDINGNPAGVVVDSSNGNGTFTVTVDVNKLVDGTAAFDGKPIVKKGWIQVTTTIHDPTVPDGNASNSRAFIDKAIKGNITATLSKWWEKEPAFVEDLIKGLAPQMGWKIDDIKKFLKTLPSIPDVNRQMSTWWIPVEVYVNSLRYAAEEKVATTDWMNLTLNVPVSKDTRGALYILAEHPSLAPGQVFAYRWIDGKPHFDVFSKWGHPVPGAENLYYSRDIQNTPIALPYSNDDTAPYNNNGTIYNHKTQAQRMAEFTPIPYKETNVGISGQYAPDVRSFIPVPFGGGIRLIGLEGDWIIRAVVGDPSDIENYKSWRELLYYVLHITPLEGRWVVTEDYNGETTTYIDDASGIVYPLTLNEERGKLSGVWLTPKGQTLLTVKYANTSDQVCKQFTIQGQRVLIDNCIRPGKYDIYFTENTIWGPFEYLYRIDKFDVETGGKIEGQWQYRPVGDRNWSVPEKFTAVTEDVVVPLDPNCNCYKVAGKVNGIATPFLVDTGANYVSLSPDYARDYGLLDVNGTFSKDLCANATGTGVGGSVSGHICLVNIEVEGVLKQKNVPAFIPNELAEGALKTPLLGMSFLKHFHVSTNANDGTMIISK